MAYPNYSDTNLNPLILNYVPDKVTFDQMENDDRIEEDQLYLIPEDDEEIAGAFFAEYGVTTYDEVVEAINSGKNIITVFSYDNSNFYLPLIYYGTNNPISFGMYLNGGSFWAVLDPDNEWHEEHGPIDSFSSIDLSDTISSSLDESQGVAATPNAVYSALANVITTGDVTGSMNTSSWNIATTIANGAVTSNKIATNAINNSHIANFSISSTKLENPSMNIAGNIVALGGSLNAATLNSKLIGSNAIGNTSTPVYWNGSAFALANEIVTDDTKNTAGATDTSDKIFLVGAKTQTDNPQTYTDDEVYVTNGTLTTKTLDMMQTATAITSGKGDLGSGSSPRYKPYLWYCSLDHDPIDGEILVLKMPSAGNTAGVYLSINGNVIANYHPIVTNGADRLTTAFATDHVLILAYYHQ